VEDTAAEQYIELKPVAPKKQVYKAVRNVIVNEFGMTKDDFKKLLEERVVNFMTGNQFEKTILNYVGTQLSGNKNIYFNNESHLRQLVSAQVEKVLNEMIGAEVKKLVAEKLKGGIIGLA
jgi:hypothetical protein